MIARRTLLEADSLRELAAALGCARVPAGEKRLGRKNSLLSRKGQRSV
jgi:hypothetical protein